MDTRFPIVDALVDLVQHVLSYPEAFPAHPGHGVAGQGTRPCSGVVLRVQDARADGQAVQAVLSAAPVSSDTPRATPPHHQSAHGKMAWTRLQHVVPQAGLDALRMARPFGAQGFFLSIAWPQDAPKEAQVRVQWYRHPDTTNRWHQQAGARGVPIAQAAASLARRCTIVAHHPVGDRLWWAGDRPFSHLLPAADAPSARLLSHALWYHTRWEHTVVNEAFFADPYPNAFTEAATSQAGQALMDTYREIARLMERAARRWEPAAYGSLSLQNLVSRSAQAIQHHTVSMDIEQVIERSLTFNGRGLDKAPANCLHGLDEDALAEASVLATMACQMLAQIPVIGMSPLDIEQWFHVHPGGDDVFMGLVFRRDGQAAFSNGLGDFHWKDFAKTWGPRLDRLASLGAPQHFWQIRMDSRGESPILAVADGADALRAATLLWHPEPERDRRQPDAPPAPVRRWETARLVSASERGDLSLSTLFEEAA